MEFGSLTYVPVIPPVWLSMDVIESMLRFLLSASLILWKGTILVSNTLSPNALSPDILFVFH